jgi:hypothetical protein
VAFSKSLLVLEEMYSGGGQVWANRLKVQKKVQDITIENKASRVIFLY